MEPLNLSDLSDFDLAVLTFLPAEPHGAPIWSIAEDLCSTNARVNDSIGRLDAKIPGGLFRDKQPLGRTRKNGRSPVTCTVHGIYRDQFPLVQRWFDEHPEAEALAVEGQEGIL